MVPLFYWAILTTFTVLTCVHDRITPRTCTPEIANSDNISQEPGEKPTHVADLAIDPETKEVVFQNCRSLIPTVEDTPELRVRMKELLDLIMSFFEDERKKLENGELKEEEALASNLL